MFLRPFGLYRNACYGILFYSICRQILLPRPRRLRPRDPWAMQLKVQQTGQGAGESPAP